MEAAQSSYRKLDMSQQSNTIVLPIMNLGNAHATAARESQRSGQSGHAMQRNGKQASLTGQVLPSRDPDEMSGLHKTMEKPAIEKIVEKLNAVSLSIGRDLRFQVNLKAGNPVIQVLDSDSGELIRQIPAEKVSSYLQSEGNLAIRLFDEQV